jgi:excinuclease ABC subunit C
MVKISEISYLPENPGCYMFKSKTGEILYIGKAKNLKKRVSSYFNKALDNKTMLLVSQIESVEVTITQNEVEALILENNLIKKHYPKYNLDLKDSKRYAYILLHEDKLPWVEVVRLREEKGNYFGPFVSGAIRKLIFDIITRTFRILTRKASSQLKKAIDPVAYTERVEQAKKILDGKVDDLIKELSEKMKIHAKTTNYEYALTLRNQVDALKTLKEKQLMELNRSVDANILNYSIVGDDVYLVLFTIRKGILEEKQSFNFIYYENFLNDFLTQYYDSAPIPQELIVPHEVDPALETYLTKKSKRKVSIIIPQKGDKKDLLELARKNIDTTFFAGSERVLALQQILELKRIPRKIECFDISHLGGTNTVASMVTFNNGLPEKSHYRKFKIHTDQNDDYLAMKEVIERRYSGSLTKTLDSPDLIVVDGGLGQLNAALESLKKVKKTIPVISLAKRLEEIYTPDKTTPISVDHKNKGLQLLQSIRDEAHRFAISYQKILRTKSTFNKDA